MLAACVIFEADFKVNECAVVVLIMSALTAIPEPPIVRFPNSNLASTSAAVISTAVEEVGKIVLLA